MQKFGQLFSFFFHKFNTYNLVIYQNLIFFKLVEGEGMKEAALAIEKTIIMGVPAKGLAGSAADIENAKKSLTQASIKQVHCFFSDIRGILQSFSIPTAEFVKGDGFNDGIGFDGSSVRGFKTIDASDMVWVPDASTLKTVPWITDPIQKSAVMFGDVYEAFGSKNGGRISDCDPRGYVAKRALQKAEAMGYKAIFGPEIEYFVFKNIDPTKLTYDLWVSPGGGKGDSWGAPRVVPESPEITPGGLMLRPKEAYFRAPPEDSTNDYRNEVSEYLTQMGVPIEYHHHEVATAGQIEINFKPRDSVYCGDSAFLYKFVARNIAKRNGLIATFMPKPLYLDNASGMHVHNSLWKGEPFKGTNAFHDENDEFGMSQTMRYYVGGILEHSQALVSITCPTVNSYKRLVPGYEAPINVCWSPRNRSAMVRVPTYFRKPNATRLEFRATDPSCNPYLAFSAIMAAGLDGIKKKIEPGDPLMHDVYEMSTEEKRRLGVKQLPTTLKDALQYLSTDEVLQEALGSHIYEQFMSIKTDEWNQFCLYVTPWEIMKYLDY